jgi:hypothetical protein
MKVSLEVFKKYIFASRKMGKHPNKLEKFQNMFF